MNDEQTVAVRIVHRRTRELIAVVTVPKARGRVWVREAKSAAVTRWRRESADHHTPVDTEFAPA